MDLHTNMCIGSIVCWVIVCEIEHKEKSINGGGGGEGK